MNDNMLKKRIYRSHEIGIFRVIVGKLQGLTIKMGFYDSKKISEMNISID